MPKKSDLQHKYSSLALFLNCPVADGRPKSEDIIALIKCAEFLAGILQREADELIAFVTPEEWERCSYVEPAQSGRVNEALSHV